MVLIVLVKEVVSFMTLIKYQNVWCDLENAVQTVCSGGFSGGNIIKTSPTAPGQAAAPRNP